MVTETKNAPRRERKTVAAVLWRFFAPIEPWYDWGATCIERIDSDGEGPGHWASLQWLGLSITIFVGRTPKSVRS